MRIPRLIPPALLLLLAAVTVSVPAQSADFRWVNQQGDVLWSATIDPKRDNDPPLDPLQARRWFPPLDPLEFVRLDDGPALSTEQLTGTVLILDFWTSWCGPCREELPRMQAFHDRNRDRGLVTLAINVREHPTTARVAAADFGLTLPLVEYDKELERAFEVSSIPTIIVVDRLGRIRGRWESFPEGVEQKVYETVDAMLEPEDTDPEAIAMVAPGGRRLDVLWLREFRAPVDGVQVLGTPEPKVVAAVGRGLQIVAPDATTHQSVPSSLSFGRLLTSAFTGGDDYRVLGYRVGGTRLARFDLPSEDQMDWVAPGPILDVQWIDPEDPSAGAVVGTMKGLSFVDAEGVFGTPVGVGLVRGLARRTEAEPGWVALTGREDERLWHVLSDELAEVESHPIEGLPWRLEGLGSGGFGGLLSSAIRTATTGRFFPGMDDPQVAVAGQQYLVILDSRTGAELFRARWDGIAALAAGDVDRDGRDELAVAYDSRLVLLQAPASE